MERIDAESRRYYDPINKIFDHGKKRATDVTENSKVTLPKPCDPLTESSIELLKTRLMEAFKKYKKKYCNDRGDQELNLTKSELRGLNKLKKRIRNRELVAIKTDKSGKLTVMDRGKYEALGKELNANDIEIDRRELRKIEGRINSHTKF